MAAKSLRVLLIGNGGREHSLAWKLAQSELVQTIHVVPGNGGTANLPKCHNVDSVAPDDFPGLIALAGANDINLCIPGPEAPLVAGIVDHFGLHAPHIRVFGPSQHAARMEGSKAFAKDFMTRHSIPTARYHAFDDHIAALAHLETVPYPVVIKADGLAAGKGVVIPSSPIEARAALDDMMLGGEFGAAGRHVVIEELLTGDEISILSLCDGENLVSLPAAQDHKRIGDGDTGPNTGGMGTYAPTPLATPELLAEIESTVLRPTVAGMARDGFPFRGCLFTGLMLTPAGPRVLEYNVRFGDPETQSCLALLEGDLAALLAACCTGALGQERLLISPRSSCTVVMAAPGYPGSYPKGTAMEVDQPTEEGMYLFHAGTTVDADGQLRTSGGRVIAATATGATLSEAVERAYRLVGHVRFEGMQYRKDIAHRALR